MFKTKIGIFFLLLLFVVNISFAAEIVIYQQGIALVTGRIDSTSKVFKIPVSEGVIPGSLNVYPVENIKKIEFHKVEEFGLEKYYESYIGRKIKFVFKDGTMKNFIILSVNPLIFKDLETGEVYPVFEDSETKEIYFKPIKYNMNSKNYFLVEMFEPVDSLNFSYLTRNISWNAKYFLVLKSKDLLDISGYFNIVNQLNSSFNNYSVYLLAGEIYQPESGEEVRFMQAKSSYAPSPEIEHGQPFGQKTGYRVYKVNISDIPEKGKVSIPIIRKELQYKRKLVSYNPTENYQPVKMVIYIKNIPIDLPKGEVKVYELIDNVEIFSGASEIRQLSKGDVLEVTYGETSDILCRKIIKSSTKISKGYYKDIREIDLKNLKDENVVVEVHDRLPNINWIEVGDQNVKFVLQSKSEVKFLVEVPAGGEFSFQYTVEYNY